VTAAPVSALELGESPEEAAPGTCNGFGTGVTAGLILCIDLWFTAELFIEIQAFILTS